MNIMDGRGCWQQSFRSPLADLSMYLSHECFLHPSVQPIYCVILCMMKFLQITARKHSQWAAGHFNSLYLTLSESAPRSVVTLKMLVCVMCGTRWRSRKSATKLSSCGGNWRKWRLSWSWWNHVKLPLQLQVLSLLLLCILCALVSVLFVADFR